MRHKLRSVTGPAALLVALAAVVLSMTMPADAARRGKVSSKPKPFGLLLLNKKKKFPAAAIPKVRSARNADRLGGRRADDLALACNAESVDLGTWCLMSAPYGPPPEEAGKTNYAFATQKCAELGGYLPTAAQLMGAAPLVKLASTLTDNATTANVDEDPSDGTKDRREMSATLVTTASGTRASGSQGVSDGSRGDPRAGEPDPVPQPANPYPDTLQYVTVYDNGDKGGFAGSRPVSEPEQFRCAFDKQQGSASGEVGG